MGVLSGFAKFSNIFWGAWNSWYFLKVKGRCWARAYVWRKNESTEYPLPPPPPPPPRRKTRPDTTKNGDWDVKNQNEQTKPGIYFYENSKQSRVHETECWSVPAAYNDVRGCLFWCICIGKDQESIQSSTTPDPGYQWESKRKLNWCRKSMS